MVPIAGFSKIKGGDSDISNVKVRLKNKFQRCQVNGIIFSVILKFCRPLCQEG